MQQIDRPAAANTNAGEWVRRPAEPDDEACLLFLWLKSYAHSAYGKVLGAHHEATPAELGYWRSQAPVVEMLLRTARVDVICDPDRVRRSAAGPSVIWAFACWSPGPAPTVHWVGVKRAFSRIGLGPDLVRALFGDMLERPCGMSHELVEMRPRGCGVAVPREWYSDPTCTARLLLGAREAA